MNKFTPEHIVAQIKNNLQKLNGDENEETMKIEKAVGICSAALLELREYVNRLNFKNLEEEIRFFKVIKPFVLGEYLYYTKLWEILTRQPVTSIKRRIKYLKRMVSETQQFFNNNPEFYLYYRSGSTHLDDKYFVRTEISCALNCHQFIFDPFFSTSHDYTLAAIKANEKIAEYCNNKISRLKLKGNFRTILTNMTWSQTKRALLEIIYGIYYTDAVNNGNVSIKELVNAFEVLFNIKLSGFYHTFYEMVQRKKQPTCYLDLMKEKLLKRMEETDENTGKNRKNNRK